MINQTIIKTSAYNIKIMKKRILASLFVLLVGLLVFLNKNSDYGTEKILIGTSFHPLAEFAEKIGGNRIEVFNLTPPGADPHEFEPAARDIARLHSAHAFFHMGAGIDPWADHLNLSNVISVRMTDLFNLMETDDEHEHEGHGHEEDPHIWLDPVLAKSMVEIIRDTLIEVDEEGRKEYEKNADVTFLKLDELHKKYRRSLSACELDHLVISHASIGYLAHRYDFHMISVSGLSPEEEPSPKRMAEISDIIKKENIDHIFFETTMSPAIAETIARETGAELLIFNNLESLSEKDIAEGKDYFSVMESNLELIKTALKCR